MLEETAKSKLDTRINVKSTNTSAKYSPALALEKPQFIRTTGNNTKTANNFE